MLCAVAFVIATKIQWWKFVDITNDLFWNQFLKHFWHCSKNTHWPVGFFIFLLDNPFWSNACYLSGELLLVRKHYLSRNNLVNLKQSIPSNGLIFLIRYYCKCWLFWGFFLVLEKAASLEEKLECFFKHVWLFV